MTRRYDYVVVGAGAAGCVVAARLAEDPAVSVLLLEAGPERRNPLLGVPAAEVLWMGRAAFDWRYETEADPTIDGRSVRIPRGRLLGGSNAINGMIFVRGQRADYDGWRDAGNPGWGWSDVLPFFRRLERVSGPAGESRGFDGPVAVGRPGGSDPLCDAFLAAAGALGHRMNPDYNSGDLEGFGYYQATIEGGRRSAVVDSHLRPARARPNLTVRADAAVSALTFDGARCAGVRYRHGGAGQHATADREVVVCAGAVGSPQLLELSGIGAAEVLAAAGVPVVTHLPGVGENFRDHFAVRLRWRVSRPITFNDRTRGRRLLRETARYLVGGDGVLGLPTALGFGFVRSTPEEPHPDLQYHFAPASYGAGASRRFDPAPGMTLGVYPLQPESAGSIHIGSPDAAVPPVIRPRFLDAEPDRRRLLAGMRLARRVIEHPRMDAYRAAELTPGADLRTDDELLGFARAFGDTSYHPMGTCRMGSDERAVVDHRLRVRGVSGLRVVDASVMPTMVSGNTNAATIMIAEKGAEMIAQDARTAGADTIDIAQRG